MRSWQLNGVDLNRWLEYQTTNKYNKPSLIGEIEDYYYHRWYQNGQAAAGPLSLVINLTNRCNLRCSHCSKKAGFNNNEMAIDSVKRILDESLASRVLGITITGGEPLIHSQFIEVVKMIKRYGFSLKTLTNLNTDSGKLEAVLDQMNPHTDVFQVSVDDVSDQYEKIRKGASFEKLSRNIKILKAQKFKVTVNMVITRENVCHMKEVFDYCAEEGIDNIRFTPYFGKDSSERLPDFRSMVTCFDQVLDSFDQKQPSISISSDPVPILYPVFEELKKDPEFCFGTDYYTCPACVTNMEINIDGYAFPCSYLDDERYYGGNILTDSLNSIWNSDTFQQFRGYVSNDEACRQCSQFEYCRGGCKADMIVHQGCLSGHDNGCRR